MDEELRVALGIIKEKLPILIEHSDRIPAYLCGMIFALAAYGSRMTAVKSSLSPPLSQSPSPVLPTSPPPSPESDSVSSLPQRSPRLRVIAPPTHTRTEDIGARWTKIEAREDAIVDPCGVGEAIPDA